MPVVPFASPKAIATAQADPTFLAIAAVEYAKAAQSAPPQSKAPNEPVATDQD